MVEGNFNRIIDQLMQGSARPLPGWKTQMTMASPRRRSQGSLPASPQDARIGSVLILIYPLDANAHTVLIQRNVYDGIHSGQVSFPGGQKEDQDRSRVETALREAWEETGIDPDQVTVIRELTELYIPPSNFLVYPILGYVSDRPQFKRDPAEVQEILEIGLDRLVDPVCLEEREIELPGGYSLSAPCYHIDGHIIWGATAMIISELLEILGN